MKRSKQKSEPVFLNPRELCERWRGEITEKTLTNWRWKNKGPRFTKVGTAVLYRVDHVEAYERAQIIDGSLPGAR